MVPDGLQSNRPGLSTEFIGPVARGLERLGVPKERFYALLGFGPGDEPRGHVSLFRAASALEMIASKKGMPHLSTELARHMPLGTLGASDYTWSASGTLFHGMLRTGNHMEIFTDGLRFELKVEAEDGDPQAHFVAHSLVDAHPPIITELTFAIFVVRMRHVLSSSVPMTAVRFRHLPRGSRAPFDAFFQVPVAFGASVDEFVVPASILQEPLSTADPELLALLRKHPRVTTAKAAPKMDTFIASARTSLTDALNEGEGDIDIVTLARRLNTSTRSLQRKLAERHTSFSDLHDGVRRELATALLSDEKLLLPDVAARLGFKDVSAFYRAFRRWTGVSPRAFQKAER